MLTKLFLVSCFWSIELQAESDQDYIIFQSVSNKEHRIADDNGYLSDKYYRDFENDTYPSHGFDLPTMPCTKDYQCKLTNYEIAEGFNSPLVTPPVCDTPDDFPVGFCSCGKGNCVSRSKTSNNDTEFYYCGPCERIGTQCSGDVNCTHILAECYDGVCSCIDGGLFYDMYYCIIPYHGYERALQLGLATCIFISVCLLLTTIYSSLYRQGRIHPYILRLISRAQTQGTQEAPPGDTPPQYDEVIANDQRLPTYQEALKIETRIKGGAENPAFDERVDTLAATENSNTPPGQETETAATVQSGESGVVRDLQTTSSVADDQIDLCPQYEYIDLPEESSQHQSNSRNQ